MVARSCDAVVASVSRRVGILVGLVQVRQGGAVVIDVRNAVPAPVSEHATQIGPGDHVRLQVQVQYALAILGLNLMLECRDDVSLKPQTWAPAAMVRAVLPVVRAIRHWHHWQPERVHRDNGDIVLKLQWERSLPIHIVIATVTQGVPIPIGLVGICNSRTVIPRVRYAVSVSTQV